MVTIVLDSYISHSVFHRKNNSIQVWNEMRVNKSNRSVE